LPTHLNDVLIRRARAHAAERRIIGSIILVAGAVMASATGWCATLIVGKDAPIQTIAEAARVAKDGDTVEILSGEYRADVAVWLQKRLTIRHVGETPVVAYGGVPPYRETRQYVAQVLHFYNTPVEWRRVPGTDIHRILQPNGSIVYTNVAFGRLSVASHGR
jgi:hypothetical protein